MKKILISVLSVLTALTVSGCAPSPGSNLEQVKIDEAADKSKINVKDFENNLDGLEKYLVNLNYIPENAEPTEMMYSVIGAIDGDRYNFKVDSGIVYVEIYEYDPENLNQDAKRVISEVKDNGSFYVFDTNNVDSAAYEAELSYNKKYLLIYTDNSEAEANIQRKKDFISAVKDYYNA